MKDVWKVMENRVRCFSRNIFTISRGEIERKEILKDIIVKLGFFSPPLWLRYSFENMVRFICFCILFLEFSPSSLIFSFVLNMWNINMFLKVRIVQKIYIHIHSEVPPHSIFFTSFPPTPSRKRISLNCLIYPLWFLLEEMSRYMSIFLLHFLIQKIPCCIHYLDEP